MKKITRIAATLFFAGTLVLPTNSYSQAGSLDLTFDTDGKVTTGIGSTNDYGQSVVIQSDGKLVVAGGSSNGTNYDIALARYNSNGSLDNSFDTDGKVTTAISSKDDIGNSVALQSDGKIVVAGMSSNGTDYDFAVVRYNNVITGISFIAEQDAKVKIYPNPASNSFTIETTATQKQTVQVFDITGKLMQTQTMQNGKAIIDASSLAQGVYNVSVTGNEGLVNKRVVVK